MPAGTMQRHKTTPCVSPAHATPSPTAEDGASSAFSYASRYWFLKPRRCAHPAVLCGRRRMRTTTLVATIHFVITRLR